jgi:hypothetical protein
MVLFHDNVLDAKNGVLDLKMGIVLFESFVCGFEVKDLGEGGGEDLRSLVLVGLDG